MIGILIGFSEYLIYRKNDIKNSDINKYNSKVFMKITVYTLIIHTIYLFLLCIKNIDNLEKVGIIVYTYFFINIFNSINIYNLFKNKYLFEEKKIILNYLLLFFGISIINIIGIFTSEIISNLIYALGICTFTIPNILKNIKDLKGKELVTEKKINKEIKNIKKRKYMEKIVSVKSVLYPYIFEIIFYNLAIFIIYKYISKSPFDIENFGNVLKIILAYKFLIETLALILGLKIYDNFIEYGEKSEKNRRRHLFLVGIIFAVIFISLIYIFPYSMLNIFTVNLANKNIIINILKHFLMTSVISFISILFIYTIYGEIRKDEINKGRYKYKEMAKTNKRKYNFISLIFFLKLIAPFAIIYLAIIKQKYKLMLYSYFLSDIIILLLILFLICINRKEK